MKRIGKGLLMGVLSLILLIGCSGGAKEKVVETFVNKLVSNETYKNVESYDKDAAKFIDDCNKTFGSELTNSAMDTLMADRTFTIYYNVMTSEKVENVSDIKIDKISETDNDGYVHYEYEIYYKLNYQESTVEMKDYMAFKVLKESNKIDQVSIQSKTSSIYKEFKKL